MLTTILNEIKDSSIQNSEQYIGIKGWSLFGAKEVTKSQAIYNQHKDRFAESDNFKALGSALAKWNADSKKTSTDSAPQDNRFQFKEVSKQTGLDSFQHRLGHKDKRWIIDAMGSGVAVADYDNDGDDDIYFVNGRPDLDKPDPQWRNRLFRNDNGRFTDVTESAGVGDMGWGMCAIFGDVNNDGWLDLFVGNYGANTFYLSNGDGTFTDRTDEAGLKSSRVRRGGGFWGFGFGWRSGFICWQLCGIQSCATWGFTGSLSWIGCDERPDGIKASR